jgi:hypothetical protein
MAARLALALIAFACALSVPADVLESPAIVAFATGPLSLGRSFPCRVARRGGFSPAGTCMVTQQRDHGTR